jgi:hypothetical protein
LDFDGPDNQTGSSSTTLNDDDQQGGRNGNSIQSWESKTMGRLQMDADVATPSITDPTGWAFTRHNGKFGVWVADSEGSAQGDEISYFELDFTGPSPTATKKTLTGSANPLAMRMDENPTASTSTNDGEIDYLAIDKNGKLVIGESGFFDTIAGSTTAPTGSGGLTAQQPRVGSVGVESYDSVSGDPRPTGYAASGGTVGFDSTSPWAISGNVPVPGDTDDTQVLGGATGTGVPPEFDGTKVAYDRSTGYVYFIDPDTDFVEDIYVFDPASGQVIYHEINGFNPGLFNQGTQKVLLRGDINDDGVITYTDVKKLKAGIIDPTLGGTVTAALGAEWYDMTGDNALTAADLTELVQSVIGTRLGDFNLDGFVNDDDLTIFKLGFGDTLDGSDFLDWQQNKGFAAPSLAANATVPEPASGLLLSLGAVAAMNRMRRRANA